MLPPPGVVHTTPGSDTLHFAVRHQPIKQPRRSFGVLFESRIEVSGGNPFCCIWRLAQVQQHLTLAILQFT